MWPFKKQPLWKPLHKKAMMAYAAAAGEESARAQLNDREFDSSNACRELGLMMCGRDRSANVDAMVNELKKEGGQYLRELIQEYGKEVLDGADQEMIDQLTVHLVKTELAPQLIICNVIENTYGRLEAARYAIAIVSGNAK